VAQPRLNSIHQRNSVLRQEHDDGMMQARMAILAGSVALTSSHSTNLAKKIRLTPMHPRTMGVMGRLSQQNSREPNLYETDFKIMGPDMCTFRYPQLSNLPELNPIINPPLHSILSCRICGRWNFHNHLELLEHENSCCINVSAAEGGMKMRPQQHTPNNEPSDIDQSIIRLISRGKVSNINVIDNEYKPAVSTSLYMSSKTGNSNDSKEAVSSFPFSNPFSPVIPTDNESSTSLQYFVHRYCMEFFTVCTSDIYHYSLEAKRSHIHTGQIGIRCPYCQKVKHNVSSEITTSARMNKDSMYFPPAIDSIYFMTLELLQTHLHICDYVPPIITERYNELKVYDTSNAISRQYWIESANALGLIDTAHGIRSSRCAHPSIKSDTAFTGVLSSDSNVESPVTLIDSNLMMQTTDTLPSIINDKNICFSDIEGGPLVDPKYRHLATAYSYAVLSQMQACAFMESDQRNKRSYHPLGYAGLACRHCSGEDGRSRFFPSNLKTMSDTSKTLNVLHSHILRCRHCPLRVKVGLQNLRLRHDEERSKMKFGSQKAFFIGVWNRLHGEMSS